MLSVRTQDGCRRTFYSSGPGTEPEWGEVTDAGRLSIMSTVSRRKTVPGIVPPIAPEGRYEVCGGTQDSVCGELVVTG